MGKNSGFLVKTKNGKIGRTYHRDSLVNKKTIVYIEENGRIIKMLCDPHSLKIVGFLD